MDLDSRHLTFVWGNWFTRRCKQPNPRLGDDAEAADLWLVRLPRRRTRIARACQTSTYYGLDSATLFDGQLLFRGVGNNRNNVRTLRLSDPALRISTAPAPSMTTVNIARSKRAVAYVSSDGPDRYLINLTSADAGD